MFEGYLELGGNEIVNSARTVGYLSSGQCASNWIVCPPCEGIQDALEHEDYTLDNIELAPWFDAEDEPTHRFLGVHALSVEGLMDSTRTASISEGITDGGVVGQVRHAVRQTRVRALLSAVGEDALESGLAWLKAALDPDFCGTHGNSCGASDSCFYTACPPTKESVVTKTVIWDPIPVVNYHPNPSFETPTGAPAVLAENLATNPSFETAGASTEVVVATNQITNPSFESPSAAIEMRRNLHPYPRAAALTGWDKTSFFTGTMVSTPSGLQFDATAAASSAITHLTTPPPLVANSQYVGSMEVTVPAGFPAITVYCTVQANGNGTGADTTIQPGQTVRVLSAVHNNASVVAGRPVLWARSVPSGARFFVRNAMLEKTATHGTYFDGSTLNAGDYSYAWTGAADVSESIQTALTATISGAAFSAAYGLQSGEWASNRAKSLRLVPNNPASSSSYLSISFGNIGLVAGRTYTFLGVSRLAAPLTGTLEARSRKMMIRKGGGTGDVFSTAAPNAAGVTEHRVTTVVNGTDGALYLWNGAAQGGGDVWWDDVLVVEGDYTGGYFDGSTPVKLARNLVPNPRAILGGAKWTGPGAQAVPSTGHPNGHTTFQTAGGGEVATYGRFTGTASTTSPTQTELYFATDLPATPSQQYSGSVLVRSSVAATIQVKASVQNAASPMASAPVVLVPNVWTLIPLAFTLASNAIATFSLGVLGVAGGVALGNGGTLDVGHPILVTGATAPPYFDGSMPGAGWEGTADASVSYSYDATYSYAWTGAPDASTSTQSQVLQTVPGVPVPPAEQATVGLTSDSPVLGSKALRFTLAGTVTIALGVTTAIPATGSVYTLIGRVRPRTRAQQFTPRIRGAVGIPFTAPKDIWTEFRVTLAAGAGTEHETGLLIAAASGHQVGDLIDVDAVVLVAGGYAGAYFDGDTTNPPFTYAWTGAAHASSSTLSGVDVAHATPPAAGKVARWQDSDEPALGSYFARFQALADDNLYFPFTDLVPAPGETYTIMGKVRAKNRTTAIAVSVAGGLSQTFQAAMDAWTSFQVSVVAGSGAAGTTGLYAVLGATQPGDVIDVDSVLITEGGYTGPYFDGDTPDQPPNPDATLPVGTPLDQYGWSGTPHASTSEWESGVIGTAPDPVAWEAQIDRLIRTMHDVTCISGPLIEQKIHRAEMWGYVVEFTLASGTPWVFGRTRPLIITPSLPIVVQDVPYNLVPYPSAELSGSAVVVARNYSTNPSVETDITGWNKTTAGNLLAADVVVARTTELASDGGASAKATFTATNTAATGQFGAGQAVELPGITPTMRYSVNLWAVASIQSGTAVLGNLEYHAYWQDAAGTTLRDDLLATKSAAGGAVSVGSILPPAGTTKVLVRAFIRLTSWSTGAIVRLYADSLAVTVP